MSRQTANHIREDQRRVLRRAGGFPIGSSAFPTAKRLCTYTEVQWCVTILASYRRVVRATERLPPSPDTPAFRFHAWLADPHPPMTLRTS